MITQTADADSARENTFPNDWEIIKLSDTCGQITTGKLDANAMATNGIYPFFTCARAIYRINSFNFDTEALLVSGNGANVGYVHYYKGKFNAYQRTYVISGFVKNVQFIRNALEHNLSARIATEARSGNTPYITMDTLTQMPILIPRSESEAESISSAIADADNLIDIFEQMIAKKKAIKQGIMQQLLSGGTRLPGFSGPWKSLRLGSVGTFLKGRGVKRDDVRSSGIPCIRYGELYTVFNDYTSMTRSFVTPDIADTALPLRTGDVLFAGSGETRGEIGKCVAYVGTTPAVAGGDIVVLRGSEFNPIYLGLLANTPGVVSQKSRAGQGDAVVHINSQALADIKIELPPLDEQDAIAEVVINADSEISVLREQLTKARSIKQGMMQELLTGRTRLPIAEAAS